MRVKADEYCNWISSSVADDDGKYEIAHLGWHSTDQWRWKNKMAAAVAADSSEKKDDWSLWPRPIRGCHRNYQRVPAKTQGKHKDPHYNNIFKHIALMTIPIVINNTIHSDNKNNYNMPLSSEDFCSSLSWNPRGWAREHPLRTSPDEHWWPWGSSCEPWGLRSSSPSVGSCLSSAGAGSVGPQLEWETWR